MTERRKANNNTYTLSAFFCRYNQDQLYVLCLLQLAVFQGLELFESGLLQI